MLHCSARGPLPHHGQYHVHMLTTRDNRFGDLFLPLSLKSGIHKYVGRLSHAGAGRLWSHMVRIVNFIYATFGWYLPIKMSTSDGAEQLMVCHTYADALAKE